MYEVKKDGKVIVNCNNKDTAMMYQDYINNGLKVISIICNIVIYNDGSKLYIYPSGNILKTGFLNGNRTIKNEKLQKKYLKLI